MKKLGLIATVVLFVGGCGWFDNYNDIEYPAAFYMAGEVPGDPITLELRLSFDDQTPDTSGVIFDWEQRGDTLWFLLKGAECDIEGDSLFDDGRRIYVSDLDTGTYTLLFEDEEGVMDTFHFEVEDSVYRMVGDSGKVVELVDNYMFFGKELRRLYPDMLLVEAGYYWSSSYEENLDSLNQELLNAGAKECPLTTGVYLLALWDWMEALENIWIDESKVLSFTFDEDTVEIENIFNKYKQRFQALGFSMGNGFYRLYETWEN